MVFATAAVALALAPAEAADPPMHTRGQWGVGITESTHGFGASGKYVLGEDFALQTSIVAVRRAAGEGEDVTSGFSAGADLLYAMPPIADVGFGVVTWNVGAGLALGTGASGTGEERQRGYATGISAIAGLELDLRPVPIDVVLEYRPSFGMPPDLDWDLLGFSAHARWWF